MATHPVPVVNFVTINENKVLEARAILEPNIDVHHLALKLEEIQGSMEEICNAKCRRATEAVNGPALVEDTALCFNALHGLPGPYIKPFLEHLGPDGLNKLLEPYEDKSAKAVSMFAYSAGPGHAPVLFQGINNGKIVLARGNTGFGWDAIFEYEGKTFGEMKPEEKNDISHRGIALVKLKFWFSEMERNGKLGTEG